MEGWWVLIFLGLLILGILGLVSEVTRPEAPPRKSDCPRCPWINPARWSRQEYIARIDHTTTFHGISAPEGLSEEADG